MEAGENIDEMDKEVYEMGQFIDIPYCVIDNKTNKQMIKYLKNSVHPKGRNSKSDI